MLERLRGGEAMASDDQVIRSARWDTLISVVLGGLITWAILISAANAFREHPQALKSVTDINRQLRPVLGDASAWAFSAGLFAAGLTSALTAPLAAAYVFAGCFGLSPDLRDWRLKGVATVVLSIGVMVNLTMGQSPSQIILTAQIINGLLLPLMVVLLLIVANQTSIMGKYRNGPITNTIGVLVLAVIVIISTKQWIEIWRIFGG
jgi:Mn2+/Fe2+ NRAMP family transporter